jgi:hypothetical protein
MEDRPDCLPGFKYFIELLEWMQSSADVGKPAADDKVEAITPMSRSYAHQQNHTFLYNFIAFLALQHVFVK